MPELSEEFIQAFCDGGTPEARCGFCYKLHYATGEQSYLADDERERLERDRNAVPHSDDAIGTGMLNGSLLVAGCNCEKTLRYEEFIWSHRHQIADYLRTRAKREKQDAERILEATHA